MRLLAVIVRNRNDIREKISVSLFGDLFAMTVIADEGPVTVKCLSSKTREAAFGLLSELIKGSSDSFAMALRYVLPLSKAVHDFKKDVHGHHAVLYPQ